MKVRATNDFRLSTIDYRLSTIDYNLTSGATVSGWVSDRDFSSLFSSQALTTSPLHPGRASEGVRVGSRGLVLVCPLWLSVGLCGGVLAVGGTSIPSHRFGALWGFLYAL